MGASEHGTGGDTRLAVARVTLRPVGTPLPMGFLGLAVATVAFAALQLDWVPQEDGRVVALSVLVLTVPVQALACVIGFLARDPVAGTGMGVLAGTWAATATATLTSPPGTPNAALGVVLVTASLAILVPAATAATTKLVVAGVMGLASLRFLLTGLVEITGSPWLRTVAGVVGFALGAVALYAALATELEGAKRRTVLPLLRRGQGRRALSGDVPDQLSGVENEAGVRQQL